MILMGFMRWAMVMGAVRMVMVGVIMRRMGMAGAMIVCGIGAADLYPEQGRNSRCNECIRHPAGNCVVDRVGDILCAFLSLRFLRR